MPLTGYHSLTMTTPDDPAYENKPSDWNAAHVFTMNAVGSEISGAFANGNGMSFGLSVGSVSGSYTVPSIAGLISAVNVSAGTTSNNLSALTFNNANGITFGLNASTLTASHNGLTSQSNQAFSAAGGSSAFQTLVFTNSNGVSWTNTNGSIAASVATTYRASNDAVGLNTAQSNVTWTVNSSGLSLDARGYAGTATTFNGANISGSMTLNSAGLNLSLSGGGGGVTNQTGPNIAAGGVTVTDGTVVFSNSNGMVFGLAGSTMTASYNDVTESMFWRPNDLITTVGAPINASASVIYCPMDHNLSVSRFDLIASVSVATAGNNSSAGFLYSATAVIYTKNGGTLSSVSSTTTNNQMSWSSNATGSVTGAFFLSLPLNVAAVADKYWVAVQLSTRATGLTGAATTSLGNTVSMMGVGSAIAGAYSVREPGAATANSNGWFYGMGMYSGTSNFSTIGLSNLTQQGTNANRANVALRMLNV